VRVFTSIQVVDWSVDATVSCIQGGTGVAVSSEAVIAERYREFLRKSLPVTDIGGDDDIFQMGFVNSLFAMQIILFVESEFGITVENEDMEIANFNTVNALVQFVRAKQTIGAGA
jgi:acyl carrier protein